MVIVINEIYSNREIAKLFFYKFFDFYAIDF